MKYCLSPKEMPSAEPEGFPEGSGNISSYTLTRVIIQPIFSRIDSVSLQYNILSYSPREQVNIFPYSPFEDSAMAALKVH